MRPTTLHRTLFLPVVLVLGASFSSPAGSAESEVSLVKAAVAAFHQALIAGDRDRAMRLLAPDAVVLEGGDLETRQQYQDHHLAADIQFAQSTKSVRGSVEATLSGEAAWVSSVSTTTGTFNGKPINLSGAELIVLTKFPSGWLIRAIHWSAHQRKWRTMRASAA